MFAGIGIIVNPVCLVCGGTGKLKAKRKAMQFNGPDVDYDVIELKCLTCNGTGFTSSSSTVPSSHRTE